MIQIPGCRSTAWQNKVAKVAKSQSPLSTGTCGQTACRIKVAKVAKSGAKVAKSIQSPMIIGCSTSCFRVCDFNPLYPHVREHLKDVDLRTLEITAGGNRVSKSP